ncbi:MAG: epoxyqueuosine reductase QueH [Lachnospiraceae bacterium]|nr:epoxyqueuosine reductase QueH [Lachnospiraceae bacterium]
MNRQNYGKLLEEKLEEIRKDGRVPTLLLHACCAPCSSYVLEYLSGIFEITVLYYNPNISPRSEYDQRVAELERLIGEMPAGHKVKLIKGAYEPEKFEEIANGLEAVPEGGERCFRCYRLRLEETARIAAEQGFDYFTTTLSISPLKNSAKLNEIGAELAAEHGVSYLFSDFKKKGGYQRSIELSREYGLYRQDYCGCVYSLEERRRNLHDDQGEHGET